MEKTKYAIQLDFKKAKAQADKLERIAREINKVIDRDMYVCRKSISNNWKGYCANEYVGKTYEVTRKMQHIAGELTKTAGVIREIAGNTFRAENSALEAVKKREYGG